MNKNIFPEHFKDFLKNSPLTLVDVGASGGIQNKWKHCAPFFRVIGFEPDERSASELNTERSMDTAMTFLSVGLYNKKASIPLYLTRNKTDSSIFEPDMTFLKKFPHADRFEVVGREVMQVDMLDNQLNDHNVTDVDFIKVDTQGSELFILQGAANILSQAVFGVEVEVEFSPLYFGQPVFSDVDVFMRSRGFQLFDIAPCFWKRKRGKSLGGKRGQIIYANVLYLKDSKTFSMLVGVLTEDHAQKSKVLRAVAICLLHGYADYALEVAEAARSIFTHEEYATLISDIAKSGTSTSIIPHFPGKAALASYLLWLAHVMEPTTYYWKQVRDEIGN